MVFWSCKQPEEGFIPITMWSVVTDVKQ